MKKEQEEALAKQQEVAGEKKATRVKFMGELLRSKGFVWVASSHDVMVRWEMNVFSATAWITTRSSNVSRRETVLSCDRLTVCPNVVSRTRTLSQKVLDGSSSQLGSLIYRSWWVTD